MANPQGHDQDLVSYCAFGCDRPAAVPDGINGWTLSAIVGGVALGRGGMATARGRRIRVR